MDIEIAHTVTTIRGLEGYDSMQALVRLDGAPIGYVRLPVVNGRCTRDAILDAILRQYDRTILDPLTIRKSRTRSMQDSSRLDERAGTSLPPSRSGPSPLVTVCVCTRGRPRDIVHCLDSLQNLDYPNIEVLVVDNAPVDDLIRRLIRNDYPAFEYRCEARPGLNWARNLALMEAKGDIIAYIDDDAVADPRWVKTMVEDFFEHPEVMAVTGLVVPYELETEAQLLFEDYGGFGQGFDRKRFEMKGLIDYRDRFHYCCRVGTGTNMAFRRNVFDSIGFFDPALDAGTPTGGGGDLDIFFRALRQGYVLIYDPRAIVRHRHRCDHTSLLKQIFTWGTGIYAYLIKTALTYPHERTGAIRFSLWWLWERNVQRFLASLRARRHPELCRLRPLILAELRGSLFGFLAYYMARRRVKRILKTSGLQEYGNQGGTHERYSISKHRYQKAKMDTSARSYDPVGVTQH
jgi:glycosyltransferase involved in cell wall biosynthesis